MDTTPRPTPTDTAAQPPLPTLDDLRRMILDDLRRENERLAAELAALRAENALQRAQVWNQQATMLALVSRAIRDGRAVEILPELDLAVCKLEALRR
jgi:ribosomal protein L29